MQTNHGIFTNTPQEHHAAQTTLPDISLVQVSSTGEKYNG